MPGAVNGFEALTHLTHQDIPADQRDGMVDSEPLFARLLLWHDVNHNGRSEPRELIPASRILSGVGLGYYPHDFRDRHGNLFAYRGFAYYVDGFQRAIFDVFLRRD